MAFIGMAHPIIAKNTAGVYSDPLILGKATDGSVTPTTYDVKYYGDDALAENAIGVTDYALVLGLTDLPIDAMNTLWGHTVDNVNKTVDYKTSDVANYVGVGFYVTRMVDGVNYYDAYWFKKVKFAEPTETFTTKGETVTFSGPSINGTASAQGDTFRESKTFSTIAEAVSWLNQKAGYTETATDTFTVESGGETTFTLTYSAASLTGVTGTIGGSTYTYTSTDWSVSGDTLTYSGGTATVADDVFTVTYEHY